MSLDLDLLKKHLHSFACECNLTINEIGELVGNSSSVSEFENKLDELCERNINKSSSRVLAEFDMRFTNGKTSSKPAPTENSPLHNELVEVKGKIDTFSGDAKPPKVQSES